MSEETFNESLRSVAGRNITIKPQFMATQGRATEAQINAVRRFIKKQKRVKGFAFSVPTGDQSFAINLAGTARLMLGYALLLEDPADPTTMPETHTLTVNNEIVVDQASPDFFSGRFMDDEFIFIPRPLSGTDDITINFSNTNAAQVVRMAFYYI